MLHHLVRDPSLLFYSVHLPSEILHATWQADMSVVLLGIFPSAMAYVLWGYVLKICR